MSRYTRNRAIHGGECPKNHYCPEPGRGSAGIILMDHSTTQPIMVSALNELAESGTDTLSHWPESFPIVGMTALRVSKYKGQS
ncbi:hypothetical protein KSS87_007470 [Heliosperma pusillum]|nr:hypothetical protein KSS87_007470 [Heliosperma pusillum]